MLRFAAFFCFVVPCWMAVRSAAAEDSSSRIVPVGAAKINVTPDYPIRLSGYGSRTTPSQGVAQKIWARALAIGGTPDDVGQAAVLLTVDNCVVPAHVTEAVSARLKQNVALPRERLVVCSTHSHTAPLLRDSLEFIFSTPISPDEEKTIARYTRDLTDKLVEVAQRALAGRRPARLWRGEGQVGFAVNRRVLTAGRWSGFGVQADGPVDHSLPILAARGTDGRLIAVLVNYACHCTTLGGDFNQICGDWAGYAAEYLERDNPGAVALISIGCGADANPNPRGQLEMCRQHADALAKEVGRLLDTELEPIDPELRCRLAAVDLPLDRLPSREEWQRQLEEGRQRGYRARHYLDKLKRGEKIAGSVSYPVATWTFGDDLAMVFLGGEVVVDYAIRLKEEFDAQRLWITAYANDVPCYIPSKRILREGGYEADRSMVYYGKPTRFSPAVEDLIVETVQRLLPPRFYSAAKQLDFPPPQSPQQALRSFKTSAAMKVELVAAEPLVVDPVAFDWGPDGKLWVVEMRDYPNGLDGQGRPGGKVKVLEDTDGDGRYDRSTLFLDSLSYPTGIKVWRSGALVTAAPEIFYAEDTDGDGRADLVKTLYRGFGEGNQQHRVNGLRWGLDNWLYVGNGDSGGKIVSMASGETVDVSGRDLRIRPDQLDLDGQSGRTQFGRARDDWGNWFGGSNSNPMWHYILKDHYVRRNPHYAPPAVRRSISVDPGAAPVYPASRTLSRFNDFSKANRFTSACSPIIYRDTLLGQAYYGNSFVCEPVHNLVHRELVSQQGVTFSSRRADDEQQSEFLASTDNWFRPSMVRTGPDGALWISDMYRFVIEHPKWIPADWQRKLDVRGGDDLGRIYRVYPADVQPRSVPRLDGFDAAELAAVLESPNGPLRDLAHQMLLWHADRDAIGPLEKLAAQSSRPQGRLHALCALEGLGALRDELIFGALDDPHAGVRRHGVRLAETRLAGSDKLGRAVLKMIDDDDPFVQLQLAYTLGQWNDRRAGDALAALAVRHAGDRYLTAAVLSSVNATNLDRVLSGVLSVRGAHRQTETTVAALLVQAAALGDEKTIGRALAHITSNNDASGDDITQGNGRPVAWQMSALADVLAALDRRRRPREKFIDQRGRLDVEKLFQRARAILDDQAGGQQDSRLAAIELLAYSRGSRADDAARLARFLEPRYASDVQSAAVAALARLQDQRTPDYLLSAWPALTPGVRARVLDVLSARSAWAAKLLAAVENGTITAAHIDARHRQQLGRHRDESIRRRALQLLSAAVNTDRQKVVQAHRDVLALAGNVQRGKGVFGKRCANCHRLDRVGHDIGPDLAALSDRSPTAMLVAMLNPNRAVEDKFLDYLVVTDDGRQFNGILAGETGNSITLVGPEGKQHVILRNRLDQLRSSGKSMMPEGLEKDLSRQEMADVIAYVRGFGPPPKQFPGNQPRVITAGDDGSLVLSAADCKIYGKRLVFETRHGNLGWWSFIDDHAVWSLVVPSTGRYRVVVDYACADDSAGNKYLLTVGGQTLRAEVTGTGTWDDYRQTEIGTVELAAGLADLVIRSDGSPKNDLLDLRAIRLRKDR